VEKNSILLAIRPWGKREITAKSLQTRSLISRERKKRKGLVQKEKKQEERTMLLFPKLSRYRKKEKGKDGAAAKKEEEQRRDFSSIGPGGGRGDPSPEAEDCPYLQIFVTRAREKKKKKFKVAS